MKIETVWSRVTLRNFLLPCFIFISLLTAKANGPDNYFATSTIVNVTPGGALRLGVPFTVYGTYTGAADKVEISLSTQTSYNDGGVNGGTISYELGDNVGYREVTITGANTWEFTYTPTHPGNILLRSRALEGGVYSAISTYTVSVLANPSPTSSTGGPILVLYDPSDPFGQYTAEILRNEGLKSFALAPVAAMNTAGYLLADYDVVILAKTALSGLQVSALTDFVTVQGGNLIAYRPDAQLDGLMGITGRSNDARSNQYLQVVTTAGTPGAGIVGETMQFHDVADNYTIGSDATAIAYFHSTSTPGTPTNPAISQRIYASKGRAIAYAYDLNRSIVFTRQGNLAWKYQPRSPSPPVGAGNWPFQIPPGTNWPIRADDLFYGNMASDPQPDWVDLNKIQIPQADEQQRLLVNIVQLANYHRKPLPKFWYFPRKVKGVFVMTGDDHSRQSLGATNPESLTGAYFNLFKQRTPAGYDNAAGVADWRAIRGTSYIYDDSRHVNDSVAYYSNQGFELSTHFQTNHNNLPDGIIPFWMNTQLADLRTHNPSIEPFSTERTHAIVWTGWAHFPRIASNEYGIRLDVNYYHFPPSWIGYISPGGERNGMYTGSAMPMRFADSNGVLINSYQVVTQLTDESAQTYPKAPQDLVNGIVNRGFYGAYCVNWHTDNHDMSGANAVIDVALSNNIPIISSRQLLNWLDAKETTNFNSIVWSGNILSFTISGGARNLNLMLPNELEDNLQLIEVRRNGTPVAISRDPIAGIVYGFVDADPGSYQAIYSLPACEPMAPILETDKTTLCPGEEAHLSITTNSTKGPFTVLVNGTSYPNVTSGNSFATIQAASSSIEHLFDGTPSPGQFADNGEMEAGVQFTVTAPGLIDGIRFLPSSNIPSGGSRPVRLWLNSGSGGSVIASGSTSNETNSGWQQVIFATPVAVTPGQTYTASMHIPANVQYVAANGGYNVARTSDPGGHVSVAIGGGVYTYGAYDLTSPFPNASYQNSDYYVDVIYRQGTISETTTYNLTSITNKDGCTETVTGQSVTITIDPNCTVTPVKFVSFTGQAQGSNAVLQWVTAMEENSSHYEVERSTDGQHYVSVGRVQAAGTTSLTSNYRFTDPALQPHRYFYRLKQVDIDKKFVYSAVISIVIGGTAQEFQLLQNTPNPLAGTAVITYVVPVNAHLRLALYDNTGRMIKVLAQGAHQPGSYRVTVSKGQLSSGIYYYRLDADKTSLIKKMVVQ